MPNSLHALGLIILFTASSGLNGQPQPTFKHPAAVTAHNQYIRAFTCYVIDGMRGRFDPECQSRDNGVIDTSGLPEAAVEGISATIDLSTKTIQLGRLREWWNTWSYPLRDRRFQSVVVDDLESFKKATGFKDWTSEIIPNSAVKQKTRVIYRSPDFQKLGISVSETYDSKSGDLSAPILETEVIIDRTDGSPHSDFYVYNHRGQLATTARFPAGERLVPTFCLGCHYRPSSGSFGRMDWQYH